MECIITPENRRRNGSDIEDRRVREEPSEEQELMEALSEFNETAL